MLITAIKPGVYRHGPTGFVVHEAYSVEDLIKAGGALFINSTNDRWWWLAGRDLRDLVVSTGATKLSDLVGQVHDISFNYHVMVRAAGSRFDYMGSFAELKAARESTSPHPNRVFAIHTNVSGGYGQSAGAIRNTAAVSFPCYVFGTSDSRSPSLTRSNSCVAGSVGTATIRSSTGVTYRGQVDAFFAAMPHQDKTEVRNLIAKAKASALKVLAGLVRNIDDHMVFDVPVLLSQDGAWRLIPPIADKIGPWNNYWGSNNSFAVDIGRRCALANGRQLIMTPPAYVNTQAYGGMWWSTVGEGASPAESVFNSAVEGLIRLTHLDGIRLERVLGGLSASALTQSGERDVVDPRNVVSTELCAKWRSLISFGDTTLPSRPLAASGLPQTDAQWTESIESGYAAAANSWVATKLTNYDSHCVGYGKLGVICAMAMSEEKASVSTAVGLVTKLPSKDGVSLEPGGVLSVTVPTAYSMNFFDEGFAPLRA